MIRPLRIAIPWDSLPLSSTTLASNAIVLNGANGLNIPDGTVIASGAYYQTPDFVLSAGYDYFSLVLQVAGVNVSVSAIPVSAADTTQQLDAIAWGAVGPGGYVRVGAPMSGVFGFYLRFEGVGPGTSQLVKVLELQLSKQ